MPRSRSRLSRSEIKDLLTTRDKDQVQDLHARAQAQAQEIYGRGIFIRGLIEVSNYCKNTCAYCGIQGGSSQVDRYRLDKNTILSQAQAGYEAGFRTLVLQGGEDPHFTDKRLVDLISSIKTLYPDVAITLSLGVRSRDSYRRLREAGADRYLLRHETANPQVFSNLHRGTQTLRRRLEALYDLKDLGYQPGTGFMVGAPGTGIDDYVEDVLLIRDFEPAMIGMGPFIPHQATPYRDEPAGSVDLTLRLLSILRLDNPRALIPSTTALNTAHPQGRLMGILAGANVLMPNLSPPSARAKYQLYDKKKTEGLESAQGLVKLDRELSKIGYHIEVGRGDPREEDIHDRDTSCL